MRPNINDIKKVQELKRVLAEKNVSSNAISTIERAIKKGMVFKKPEDLAILNIPTLDLSVVSEAVDFGVTTVIVKNLKRIEYTFRPIPVTEEKFFYGYQLVLIYTNRERFTIEQSYPIEDVRVVIIDLDLNDIMDRSKISLQVKSAQGNYVRLALGAGNNELKGDIIEINIPAIANATINVGIEPLTHLPNPLIKGSYQIKGKLISNRSEAKLDGYQVVIFAATTNLQDGNPEFSPVAFARTESNGYFVTSFLIFNNPDDINNVIAGKATITKDDLKKEQLIKLIDKSEGDGELAIRKSMLPDRLILVINEESDTTDGCKDCGCSNLNFHEKKVLEEYSYYTVVRTTEPSIIADVLEDEKEIELDDLYGIRMSVPFSVFQKFHAIESKQIKSVNFNASISTAFGRTVELASAPKETKPAFNRELMDKLLIEHKVKTIIKGNAKPVFKGRTHLNQINQIDWDDEPTIYQAASIAHGHLLHFKQEWIPDGYSIGDLVYSLPLAPGQKKQIAVLDWERRESAANSQFLGYEETLNNSLVRDRDINEVVSATLTENIRGNSKASTGGIGFGLGSSVMGIIPGVGSFGSLLGISGGKSSSGSNASQNSNRESTANSLQSIADRTMQAASVVRSQRSTVVQTVSQGERVQATAESVANYNHCHAITIQYFEVLRHFAVRNRIAGVQECLFIPLQMTPFDLEKCLRWRNTLEKHLYRRELRHAFEAVARIENEKESAFENYYDSIGFPRKNFAEQSINYLSGELFLEFYFFNTKEMIDEDLIIFFKIFNIDLNQFKDRKLTDDELSEKVGPRTIEYLLNAIMIETDKGTDLKLDISLMSPFRQNARLQITLRHDINTPISISRNLIDAVNIRLDETKLTSSDVTNIKQFKDKYMKIKVRSGNLRYRTDNFSGTLFSGRIDNDLFVGDDAVFIPTPLTRDELRNPRGEDVEAANNLIHHLNENLEYYHKCLFFDMTPERRFMLLDGIIAPGKANGRSVASVVENRVIGIAGNSLIMPVAPGNQLDPTIDETFDLFAQYYQDEQEPMRISMPTKGIYAESVMGKCNSCEEKDESRFWRWEESPIPDSPNTQILPLNTDTRRADPGNLQPNEFPNPVVNIQNAPSIPDPTGLQALLQLIGKGDSFRDLTGLNQNQLNALATFQKIMETTQAFGKEAAELAKAAAANKLIEDGKNNGALSNEKSKELTEKNINATIPSTPEERLSTAQKSMDLVQEALEKGNISQQQAQDLNGMILNDSLRNNNTISQADVNDLASNFNKDNISSISVSKPGETVEVKAFDQAIGGAAIPNALFSNLTKDERTFNARTQNITGQFGINVASPAVGNTYFWDWDITNYAIDNVGFFITPLDSPVNSRVSLNAFRPGIHYLKVSEINSTTGIATGRAGETVIGTPQFVTVKENAGLFDAVLTQFNLLGEKGRVTQSANETCNELLKKVNVRVLWDVGTIFNEQLPVIPQPDVDIYTNYLAGTPLSYNINSVYNDLYVTKVLIQGSQPAANPFLAGETKGVANTVGIYSFNEQVNIYPGSFDTRAHITPGVGKLPVQLGKIFDAFDAQRILSTANPNDINIRMEFNRLQQLLLEVVGRLMGRTIAHEIIHALLGNVGGLSIDGHAQSGLLAPMPNSLQDAIGIEIFDEVNFPKALTYKFYLFPFTNTRTGPANAMKLEPFLQNKLDLLYPIPPIRPFN